MGRLGLTTLTFFGAAALAFNMIAITYMLVVYVISIKRLSTVFSVLWGKLFFKEQNIRERLVGTLIMVAGVLLIALA